MQVMVILTSIILKALVSQPIGSIIDSSDLAYGKGKRNLHAVDQIDGHRQSEVSECSACRQLIRTHRIANSCIYYPFATGNEEEPVDTPTLQVK
jgi:ribosomal protein L32